MYPNFRPIGQRDTSIPHHQVDEDTGMWIVCPGYRANNTPEHTIIHTDAIYHAAHLIPMVLLMYGMELLWQELKFYHSYDAFQTYYVNKYADHHTVEIAF
ncbi:uncharacterized protein BJ212DRAFT_1279960 [Suillus subaureus]|uniref:Uncharacterized protein n=1 Tax=Suillus subaureus TaxID=48587 RepID=A0A9P7E255_9AGAM|nr:uncharacterized protein BJ212DRAFT_1279960 [Suillus subaureus]KAG1809078.1 hypothetical protein BJ212DRAFT_1279960 [Suillus subaureus]